MAIDARTLLIATGTDAAVGLVCLLCMAALRAGAPLLAGRLYTPRLERPAPFARPPPGVPDPSWPAPPPLPVNPLRWAAALLRLDSATVAASAGADAAAFASLTLGFGLRLSLLLLAICVPTLVPVNLSGGALPWASSSLSPGGGGGGGGRGGAGEVFLGEAAASAAAGGVGGGGDGDGDGRSSSSGGGGSSNNSTPPTNAHFSYFTDLDRLSLSNVEQGSSLMWAHLLAVYAVTLATLWLLQTHSSAAARLRVRALAAARPGGAVASRTVLVTDVPGVPYGTVAQRLSSLLTGGGSLSRLAASAAAVVGRAQRGRLRHDRGAGAGGGPAAPLPGAPPPAPSSFRVGLDELEDEGEDLEPEVGEPSFRDSLLQLRMEGAEDEERGGTGEEGHAAAALAAAAAAGGASPQAPGPSQHPGGGGGGARRGTVWSRAQETLRANGGDVEELVRAEFERAYGGAGAEAAGAGSAAAAALGAEAAAALPPAAPVVVAVHAVRRWPPAATSSAARLTAASQVLADAVERRARQVERFWGARERWARAAEAQRAAEAEAEAAAAGTAATTPLLPRPAARSSPSLPPPPQLPRAPPAVSPANTLRSPEGAAWLVSRFGPAALTSPPPSLPAELPAAAPPGNGGGGGGNGGAGGLDAVEGGAAWLSELMQRHAALDWGAAAALGGAAAAGEGGDRDREGDGDGDGDAESAAARQKQLQQLLPAAFVTFRTRWTAAIAATALHSRAPAGAAVWQVRPAPEPDDVLWGGAAISVAAEAAAAAAEAATTTATGTAATTAGPHAAEGSHSPPSPAAPSQYHHAAPSADGAAATAAASLADHAAALSGAAAAAAAAARAAAADPSAPQRLAMREWERRARAVLLAAALLALGAFYTVPVGALQALLEVDALEKDFPWVRRMLAVSGARPLLVAVLPGAALRLFIVALPAVLAALIRRAGGPASMSEVDFAVARAYFGFQVWLVFFASFAAGSALAQARAMAASPERALRALGGAAPQTAGFFCSYLALQALLVRPLMLFRPWDAAALAIRTAIRGSTIKREGSGGGGGFGGGGHGGGKSSAGADADADSDAVTADAVIGQGVGWNLQSRPYGAVLPNSTMAVLLAVAFAPVAPVILPFAVLFFAAAALTERHLAVYVVRRPFESGGRLWRSVVTQVVTAVYIMQALALGLLLVKRFPYAPLVLPAPLIVAALTSPGLGSGGGGGGGGGSGGGLGAWDTLSLEDARALDAAEARRDARAGAGEEAVVGRIRAAAAAYRSPPRLVDGEGVARLLALGREVAREARAAERQGAEDLAAWRGVAVV